MMSTSEGLFPPGIYHKQMYEIRNKHSDHKTGWIQVMPFKCLLPEAHIEFQKKLNKFQINPSDIFICGYPRSGCSWIQEIVWRILHNLDGADINVADPIHLRTPLLEADSVSDDESLAEFLYQMDKYSKNRRRTYLEYIEDLPSPRIIKTRLLHDLFPKTIDNAKIIYVMRNPSDCMHSYFDWHLRFKPMLFTGNVREFCKDSIAGKVMYGDVYTHIQNWLINNGRRRTHILVLRYEELHDNIGKHISQIGRYLNIPINEDQIKKIKNLASLDALKAQMQKRSLSIRKALFLPQFVDTDTTAFNFGKVGMMKRLVDKDYYDELKSYMDLIVNEVKKAEKKVAIEANERRLNELKMIEAREREIAHRQYGDESHLVEANERRIHELKMIEARERESAQRQYGAGCSKEGSYLVESNEGRTNEVKMLEARERKTAHRQYDEESHLVEANERRIHEFKMIEARERESAQRQYGAGCSKEGSYLVESNEGRTNEVKMIEARDREIAHRQMQYGEEIYLDEANERRINELKMIEARERESAQRQYGAGCSKEGSHLVESNEGRINELKIVEAREREIAYRQYSEESHLVEANERRLNELKMIEARERESAQRQCGAGCSEEGIYLVEVKERGMNELKMIEVTETEFTHRPYGAGSSKEESYLGEANESIEEREREIAYRQYSQESHLVEANERRLHELKMVEAKEREIAYRHYFEGSSEEESYLDEVNERRINELKMIEAREREIAYRQYVEGSSREESHEVECNIEHSGSVVEGNLQKEDNADVLTIQGGCVYERSTQKEEYGDVVTVQKDCADEGTLQRDFTDEDVVQEDCADEHKIQGISVQSSITDEGAVDGNKETFYVDEGSIEEECADVGFTQECASEYAGPEDASDEGSIDLEKESLEEESIEEESIEEESIEENSGDEEEEQTEKYCVASVEDCAEEDAREDKECEASMEESNKEGEKNDYCMEQSNNDDGKDDDCMEEGNSREKDKDDRVEEEVRIKDEGRMAEVCSEGTTTEECGAQACITKKDRTYSGSEEITTTEEGDDGERRSSEDLAKRDFSMVETSTPGLRRKRKKK